MRQLDAELRRFFARRIVRGTLLIAALIVVISVGIATARGHKNNEAFFAPVQDPGTGRVSQQYGGSDSTTFVDGNDTRMNVGRDLEKTLQGTGVALLFAGFALGASFVGAEFNVGSLTTQLLFEPRRWRVHLAKAAAVAIGIAVFVLAVEFLLALSMYLGSATRGVVQGVDTTFVVDRIGEALRIAAVIAAGATFAYSVTLVARRSSAGMIAFFLQFPLLGLIDPDKAPWGPISHYAPLRGLLAVLVDPSSGSDTSGIHTMAGGVALTAVWIVVIVGGAGLFFSRAEVR